MVNGYRNILTQHPSDDKFSGGGERRGDDKVLRFTYPQNQTLPTYDGNLLQAGAAIML